MKKVEGYTGFSGNTGEQSGYYLAFVVNPPQGIEPSSPTVTVNDVLLDGDLTHVTRVATLDGEMLRNEIVIKAKWSAEGQEITNKIALNGLSLEK